MEDFEIHIGTGNAAFAPDKYHEVARILRELADKVTHGIEDGPIKDYNGNKVGFFKFTWIE